jgi:hypothetical protein
MSARRGRYPRQRPRPGCARFKGLPPIVAKFWQVGEQNVRLVQHTIPARNALLAQLSDTVDDPKDTLAQDLVDIETDVSASGHVIVSLLAGSLAPPACSRAPGCSRWATPSAP